MCWTGCLRRSAGAPAGHWSCTARPVWAGQRCSRSRGTRVRLPSSERSWGPVQMDFGFAAVHQLCIPLLDHLDAIPAAQRKGLNVTFRMRLAGAGPVLGGPCRVSLLAEVAAERPLACLIDDEQWLDQASAQVLAFVSRRLGTESVGLVFGADPER